MCCFFVFFFFKQKTAYEMRISDWSSDVCSSDLQRRGLSFGAGGLDVATEGPTTRIVLNGVHLGPNGQVTGLDAIPLLRINGAVPTAGGFDMRSTFNGCVILHSGPCAFLANPELDFPVQDLIEEKTNPEGDPGKGPAQQKR